MKKILFTIIVLFSYNLFTLPTEAASYSDVNTKHPSYDAIQWAAKNGVASGSNGKFNPSNYVTEAQFAKMYAEFFQFPSVPNERTNSKVWSDVYYDRLSYYNAPVKGTDLPAERGKSINRGTLAQLIAFAHGKPSDLNSAVTYLMAAGISTGQNMNESDPAKKFGASNSLTRAQAVTFLYRVAQNNQDTLAASVLSSAGQIPTTKPTPPPSETLEASKLYDVGGNVSYYITNPNYNAFELSILDGKDKIGGYLTKKGASFEGFEIGKAYTGASKVTKNGKVIHILVDKLNGNKIDALYWENADEVSAEKFEAMKKDTSARKYTSLEFLFVEITNASRANHGVDALK
ncbi:MAG: S-layer homology domain-containing protein, partial [Solibacillus sp.]